MQLKLYNELKRSKGIFTPIDRNNIKLYVCGPTIYDYIHIGNARSLVVFDLLFRTLVLIYGENSVTYVRNITDVDDKINDRAKLLGISINELTKETLENFHQDAKYLNCLAPNYEPKALDHIDEMINIISILLQKQIAYISEDHVYFDVGLYKDYYELSHNNLKDNISGVRIEIQEGKKNSNDFVLWKPSSPKDDISSIFYSPWGKGRPGWHIECSAMSHKYLGENFDIHGGGIDLIFPHHTNEIAQSRSAFDHSLHAKYWVHNGFLTINGNKMSKSLGNFITVKNIRDQKIHREVLRLTLMSTYYRKPLDYSEKALASAKENLDYFYRSIQDLDIKDFDNEELPEEFKKAITDDLNINEALAFIHKICKELNNENDIDNKTFLAKQVKYCCNFLGILNENPNSWFGTESLGPEIESLVKQRIEHKKNRNWKEADQIRDILYDQGVVIEDKSDGTCSIRKK